jgi:hypothetical protein
MNYDSYIKKLFIILSQSGKYKDITITTYEKYNEEYKSISRSVLLQYKEPTRGKKNEYCQYKEWFNSKRELLKRLNELWQKGKLTKR